MEQKKTIYYRACAICGGPFETTDSRKIYCCTACAAEARKYKRIEYNAKAYRWKAGKKE